MLKQHPPHLLFLLWLFVHDDLFVFQTAAVYERLNHTSRLKNIYECFMDTIRSYILKYGGAMTAFSMLIPAAYVHESNVSQEDGTANYMLRSTLLMSLANAVKDLADSINCLNELVGVGGRVMHLSSVLQHCSTAEVAETAGVARHPHQDAIEMVELNVAVPTSATATTATTATAAPLIKQLTTTIQSGQHTVVVGPNGTGKTSLFRTLGGVWSPASGSAVVPSGMYIMPQRPNFTWRAALWEQVAYPWEREPRATSAKGRQEIEQWLTVVGLGQIVEERGLDANDDDFHSKNRVFVGQGGLLGRNPWKFWKFWKFGSGYLVGWMWNYVLTRLFFFLVFWNQKQRRCRVVNNNVSCGPACCTMWFPEAKTAAVPHLLALSCWMKQRRRYPRIGSVVCMPWPKRTASPWCPLRTAKQSNSTMTM